MAKFAGMQLAVFTASGENAKTAEAVAGALLVNAVKLRPLLCALVTAGLMSVEHEPDI